MADKLYVTKENETFLSIECEPSVSQELYEFLTFTAPNSMWMKGRGRYKKWDGKIHLYNRNSSLTYYGLFPYLKYFAHKNGYDIEFAQDVLTTNKVTPEELFEFTESLNLPMKARDYQLAAFHIAVKNKRVLIISPTASGKSLIYYIMCRFLINQGMKGLLVVPTINLTNQMISDFKDYSVHNKWNVDENCHMVYYGQEKWTHKSLTVGTWQSIHKQEDDYFQDIDFVIIDECHLATAKSLKGIMDRCVNTHIRLGMTGTLDGTLVHKVQLEGLFGPIKRTTTTRKLIDNQILAKLNPIKCMVLKYSETDARDVAKLDYQKEMEWLVSNERRNKFIVNLARSLNGNTIILYQFIEKHGLVLHEMLQKLAKPTDNLYLVHGQVTGQEREAIRRMININKESITVASSGTFSVGVNIPNLNNIIFASPSKGKIKTLQSIGRGLRKSETKVECDLYDIVDNLIYHGRENITFRHFLYRLDIYSSEQFEYKTYPIDFSTTKGLPV